jgi:hypothetical protein
VQDGQLRGLLGCAFFFDLFDVCHFVSSCESLRAGICRGLFDLKIWFDQFYALTLSPGMRYDLPLEGLLVCQASQCQPLL